MDESPHPKQFFLLHFNMCLMYFLTFKYLYLPDIMFTNLQSKQSDHCKEMASTAQDQIY